MNYSNHSSRLRLPADQPPAPAVPTTILSLESGRHGPCLRVRKVATATRRKLTAFQFAPA